MISFELNCIIFTISLVLCWDCNRCVLNRSIIIGNEPIHATLWNYLDDAINGIYMCRNCSILTNLVAIQSSQPNRKGLQLFFKNATGIQAAQCWRLQSPTSIRFQRFWWKESSSSDPKKNCRLQPNDIAILGNEISWKRAKASSSNSTWKSFCCELLPCLCIHKPSLIGYNKVHTRFNK